MARTYRDSKRRKQPSTEEIIECIAEQKKPKEERKKRGPQSPRATAARKERAVLDLVLRNTPEPIISSALDVDRTEIARIREKFSFVFKCLGNNEIEEYEQIRGKILTAVELQLIKSMMDPDKLERATVQSLAYAMRESSTLRRLESGLSTSNVAMTFAKIKRP